MTRCARLFALAGAILALGVVAPMAVSAAGPLKANTDSPPGGVLPALGPTVIDVLANDAPGAASVSRPLTISRVTQGAHGTVTTDGRSVVYNPAGCYTGLDQFTYTMTDGATSSTGTVIFTVKRTATAPVADAPTSAFIAGSTIGSTVPLKVAWCGLPAADGSSISSYRLEQTTNAAAATPAFSTIPVAHAVTSTTRNVALNTPYAWRIKAMDAKGRLGATYAQSITARVVSAQDKGGGIAYSAGWKTASSSRDSGGTEHYIAKKGATATLSVSNVRQFAIVASRAKGRGGFHVYVDGKRVTANAVSEKSSTSSWRRVLYVGNVPDNTAATHTIQVRTTGASRVDLDAILTLSGRPTPSVRFSSVAPATAKYGDPTAYAVAASSSTGLPVTLAVQQASWTACSLGATGVTFHGTGTCTIAATAAADPSWRTASATQSFTVSPAPLTVTGLTVTPRPYDATATARLVLTNPDVTARRNGDDAAAVALDLATVPATGLFSSANVGARTVTVSGLRLKGTRAAFYTLVPPSFPATITQRTLTVTAQPKSRVYGAADPALTFVYGAFAGGETAAVIDTPPVCAVALTHTQAGTYGIHCSGGVDDNYKLTPVDGTFSVTPKSLVVTASSASAVFGASVPVVTASYAGFVGSETASVLTLPVACRTTYTGGASAGTYPTTCSGAAAANYAISYVAGSFVVGRVAPTVSVTGGTSTVDGFPHGATGFTHGVGGVSDVLSPAITLRYSGTGSTTYGPSSAMPIAIGTYLATGTFAGNTNYLPATGTAPVIITDLLTQAIDFSALADQTYGSAPFGVSATGGGSGNPVVFSSLSASVCGAGGTNGATITIVGAGTCRIQANQAGTALYASADPVESSFTVVKKALLITASSPAAISYGTAAPMIVASYAGFAGSEGPAALSAAPVCGTSYVQGDAPGSYGTSCSGATAANYQVSYAAGSFDVVMADQTVAFDGPAPDGAVVGGSIATPSASASSGLHAVVSVDIATTANCHITGGTLYYDAAGTCTLDADQAGNLNWNAAMQVQQSFAIGLTAQTITFNGPGNQTYGDLVTVTATAGSGLTVTVASLTADVCTVSEQDVTLVDTGTCTLEATQAGNTTYAAATPVRRTFTATPRPITVTAVTDTRMADGTTASSGTPTVTTGNLAAGDTAAFTQAFDNVAAGPNKTITPTGDIIHGATSATARYSITWQSVSTGTILPGPAAMLTVAVSAEHTAGNPFALSVTARDQYGNGDINYLGTIHVTSTDGSATLPPDFEFTWFEVGTKLFTGVTLRTAGLQTITVSDGTLTVTTGGITVSPAAASLSMSTIAATPASIAGDGSSTALITVQLRDAFGNPLATGGETVTLAVSGPGSVGSVIDNDDGTYTATYTSDVVDAPDTATINGTLNGQALAGDATVALTP